MVLSNVDEFPVLPVLPCLLQHNLWTVFTTLDEDGDRRITKQEPLQSPAYWIWNVIAEHVLF
jgi:hypothetical protein